MTVKQNIETMKNAYNSLDENIDSLHRKIRRIKIKENRTEKQRLEMLILEDKIKGLLMLNKLLNQQFDNNLYTKDEIEYIRGYGVRQWIKNNLNQ